MREGCDVLPQTPRLYEFLVAPADALIVSQHVSRGDQSELRAHKLAHSCKRSFGVSENLVFV
jgi:hypothetical protein